MKKYIALILSCLFLFFGLGFNSVHYCCAQCRAAGIAHILQDSCDSIHQSQSGKPSIRQDTHHDACSIHRLTVDSSVLSSPTACPMPPVLHLTWIQQGISQIKYLLSTGCATFQQKSHYSPPDLLNNYSALAQLRIIARWII